jgi:hypothetical protein
MNMGIVLTHRRQHSLKVLGRVLTNIGTDVHHCVSILDLNAMLHVAAIPEDFVVYEEALHLGPGCHFPPIGQLHQILTIQSDRLVSLCQILAIQSDRLVGLC